MALEFLPLVKEEWILFKFLLEDTLSLYTCIYIYYNKINIRRWSLATAVHILFWPSCQYTLTPIQCELYAWAYYCFLCRQLLHDVDVGHPHDWSRSFIRRISCILFIRLYFTKFLHWRVFLVVVSVTDFREISIKVVNRVLDHACPLVFGWVHQIKLIC